MIAKKIIPNKSLLVDTPIGFCDNIVNDWFCDKTQRSMLLFVPIRDRIKSEDRTI